MSSLSVSKSYSLVLQGGGTRGAFTSGVLDVFMEHGLYFPYVIGTSAGGLNAVNYLSKDIGRSKYVSTVLVSDPKFLSMRNYVSAGSAFDFDYLFHTVPYTKAPFDQKTFERSPIRFLVATTSVETGKAAYFEKGVCGDFYAALAATASLPLISKPVDVEGHLYMDGSAAAPIPFQKAFEDGAEKLVIIETRARGYRKKPNGKTTAFFLRSLYRKHPKFLKAVMNSYRLYNDEVEEIDRLADAGEVFLICPDVPPEVGLTERNEQRLVALYEQGREVAEREFGRLLDFLGIAHE